MDTNSIMDAVEVLNWLTRQCLNMPESQKALIASASTLASANLLLLAYVQHIHAGCDPYDALLKASRGEPASPALLPSPAR